MNKWLLILITLSLSIYSVALNGQTTLLDIETTPPDSIIVCGDSAFFSIEITNTHSQQLTNLVFNPKMIPGMIYIPGSVTGMAQQNITTPNEPLFSLNEINPNQTITLTFYAKAECSIINQIINLGGSSSSGGLATNQTRIDYLNSGASEFSLEVNGSNSYNILYADIFISTITNQVMQTIPGATYTRNISIQNGGLGKVESLTLLIDFETGVAISGTNIGSFNLSGQLATVTLGPAEFAMFGNGDGYFELDEVLTLVDTVTMLTCVGGETKYTAFWGCNPLDTCQQDNAYANSILIGGQPIIQSDIITNEPTFFGCADTGIVSVEYNNVGVESSVGGANYYNIVMRYESSQEIVNYVGAMVNGVDLFAAGIPTNTIVFNSGGDQRERKELLFDNFFTTDPDGPGGLEDLDNDGFYDDMASGETLLATYKYLLESPLSFSNCPVDFHYQFFRESIRGQNNCGNDIWGQGFRNAHVQGNPNGAALVTGPSDIFANDTITITFENSFIFNESGRFKSKFPSPFISVLKCDSSQVKTYLTLDPGFQIVPGSVMANGVPTTFTVNGSLVTIYGGQLVGREATNHFSLDLTYDCSVPITVGGILEWRSVLSCDCGDEINLGCQSQFISRHCPGPPCFGTRSFEVNRTTLGWTDSTQSTLVSPSTPGLALNRAYQCDTVCAYASGNVGIGTGLSLNNAHLNMWYRAPAFDHSFNYGRGEWIIYDASTGTSYTVPTTLPTLTTNGAPSSTHQMTFDATNAITSTIGTLEEGDSLNIKLYLAVNKTADFPLGAYQFPRFRAQHAHVDANGDTITCSSFGAKFTILKTKTFIQNQIGSTNLGHFDACGQHKFKYGSQIIGGLGIIDDFPNEFRPMNRWDDTLCYTLPKGMYYVPNSLKFNNGPASTVNPAFDPATGKLTLIGSDLFPNGWPLLDRVDDQVRTIEFFVSRDCDIAMGNNIIPSKYGFTDFASAPTPHCYEYTSSNTDWEIIVSKPNIEMDASLTIIEGFESDLEWNVRVCNNGNVHSANNWVYINDTSGNLTVVDIVDLSNGSISLPFSQVGNYIYVNIGTLLESSCIDLEITTLNSDCTPGVLNSLELFSGWSCGPNSTYDPTACHTDTIPLQYISRRANLQTKVTFPANNLIDVCVPFDIKVLLVSSLEADMDDIVHFIELPVGLSVLPGATYEYPLGSAPQPLPSAVDQFGTNTPGWDLTSIIPGLANNFVGTRDTLRNKLKLNYSLIASCDFDPYNLIGINSHGNTNCNELVDLTARKKILINGFSALDTTEVNLSLIDNSSNCVNQVSAVITVQNQSSGNLNPLNKLEVILPAGMSYVTGSYIPNPIIQSQGGFDLLIFDYPTPLASGTTASFNFDLALDQTITCGPYSIIARSIIRDTSFCASLGQSCDIGATTGTDTAAIAIQTTIDPSFTSSVIEPCLGDSFTLTSVATCGTHFWDFGDGNTSTAINPTHTYNGVPSGLYTITHIITGPCSTDTNVTTINVINQCCMLNLSITTTAINCNGSCDGTATAVVSNGTAPYTYLWGDASTNPTIANLCAGTYVVTVTDANACSMTTTVNITNPIPFQASITSTNVPCAGSCDGTASTLATGGMTPYTYVWSNGATNNNLSGLCSGTYATTVTDANGCQVILTTVITEPTPLSINITTTDVSCNSNLDTTVCTATAWNNNRHAVWLPNLPNTPDSKFVFENNSGRLYQYPNGTARITGTIVNRSDVNKRWAVDVYFTNGMDWTNWSALGRNYKDESGLVGLNYIDWTYYIMDATKSNTLTGLGNYSGIVLNLTHKPSNYNFGLQVGIAANSKDTDYGFSCWFDYTSTNASCLTGHGDFNGDLNCPDSTSCDGTAQVIASGGTGPYTYNWSNGSSSNSLTGLCPDTLTVTVTDSNGCSIDTTVIINTTICCSAAATSTNITCAGNCDGTASVINATGTAPYTYQWNNGGNSAVLNNLCVGTYTVTITDANGCVSIATATVTSPTPITVTIDTITNVSCVGNCDGAAAISVTGGVAPYTYAWSNGATNNNLSGLCSGTYTTTVTDANGCTSITTVVVTSPSPITVTIGTITNVSCVGSCDGTASILVTGGIAPYNYAWSNGATNNNLSDLCSGTYTTTVTDANGCQVISTVVITEPTPLSINITTTDVSCNSNLDTTVCTATAWNNNRHAVWLPNLPNTPDSKFVFENNSGRLYQYPNGTARITGTIVNRSDVNKRWAVDVYFTNGMDWTNWSALGRSYKDESGLVGQNYIDWTYYIMDATKSNTLTGLGNYSGIVLNLTHKPSNYNFGLQVGIAANSKDTDYGFSCWFDYTSTNASCLTGHGDFNGDLNCPDSTSCDGTAQVTTSGGTAPYTYNWSNGSSSNSLAGLCADTFSVTITDANGCSIDTTIIINTTICCSVSAAATNTSCADICDGTVCVVNPTGIAPYTYQWSNGGNSAILNNLCAGTYTVTITDSNGCTSTATAVVTSPAPISVSIDTTIDESCAGNDGAAILNITGGTAPYAVDLANFTSATTYSNSTGNFTGLNAGQYMVNVIDTNGCTVVCATTFTLNGCTPMMNSIVQPNSTNPVLMVNFNAASSAIQVNYQTTEKRVGISILNAKGKSLLNKENLKGTDNFEIPTNNWTENTYWIILRGENNQVLQTKKLPLSE